MTKVESYTGLDLMDMLAAAKGWLEKSTSDIDALNVFPVPDGDTGTNMLLTLNSTLDEMARCQDHQLNSIAQCMARGSLMGARGNSGVILSQILRGLAQQLGAKETFNGLDIALALGEGAKLAYKSISQPVEGTMLTVIRETATAAQQASNSNHGSLLPVLETAVKAARDSVAKTPSLLPVLRQAGVVDAGGQGLYVLLEGMLLFLRGELESLAGQKPQVILPSTGPETNRELPLPIGEVEEEKPYGYCTEFLMRGQSLSPEAIRKRLDKMGESLMVAGVDNTIKVHIHTYKPGQVLALATRLGTLHDISIRNMDDQHQEYLKKRQSLRLAQKSQPGIAPTASVPIATIAVVSGEGLARVFWSLGATAIVPGGPTMNPSTQELLQAIEALPSEKVILLPNNKNIIPAAKQAQSLTNKKVIVVPSETIPQGVASLMAFNPEVGIESNTEAMERARGSVKTVSLTYAVRPSPDISGLRIKQGQPIGLIDDKLVAAGKSLPEALEKALSHLDMAQAEAITIYCGQNIQPNESLPIEDIMHRRAPQAQIEVVDGEQPHYPFIISVE